MSVLNWAFKAKGGVISAIKKSNIKTIYYGLFFREHWRSWSLQKFIVIFFFWKSLWEAFGLKMREKSKMQAFSLLGIERSSNVMLPLREPAFSERWNSVVTDSFFFIYLIVGVLLRGFCAWKPLLFSKSKHLGCWRNQLQRIETQFTTKSAQPLQSSFC